MSYPLVPSSWTDAISQNLYASLLLVLIEVAAVVLKPFVVRLQHDWSVRSIRLPVVPTLVSCCTISYSLLLLSMKVVERNAVATLTASLVLTLVAWALEVRVLQLKARQLTDLQAVGIRAAVVDPTVEDYSKLLKSSRNQFLFMGLGAEKLTRDFPVFQDAMNRCATADRPVRFLLTSPDVPWLQEAAERRGLASLEFRQKLLQSLVRLKAVKEDSSIPIEVRFYRLRPTLRLIFTSDVCWLGYYSESVNYPGKNEFENMSHSNVVFGRDFGSDEERAFCGALRAHFETRWNDAEPWDFARYLK